MRTAARPAAPAVRAGMLQLIALASLVLLGLIQARSLLQTPLARSEAAADVGADVGADAHPLDGVSLPPPPAALSVVFADSSMAEVRGARARGSRPRARSAMRCA